MSGGFWFRDVFLGRGHFSQVIARDNYFGLVGREKERERRAFDVIRQLDASPPSLECI